MTFRRSPAILTLISLALVACADPGDEQGSVGTDPRDLTGVVWTLDGSSMADLVDDVPSGATVTLAFEDGQAHGSAACNSYGGSYEAGDDGSLSLDGFAVTEMACEPALMALESAYLEALGAVTGFFAEGRLDLIGDEVALIFYEEMPPVALPLVGTPWQLTTFATGEVVFTVLAGTELTATLDGDGALAGSAGCNTFSGTYTSAGNALSFSPLTTTKMRCHGEVMAQETAFLDAMAAVQSFSIEGGQLSLLDAHDALLLAFDGPAS